jgi:hypothetical protein
MYAIINEIFSCFLLDSDRHCCPQFYTYRRSTLCEHFAHLVFSSILLTLFFEHFAHFVFRAFLLTLFFEHFARFSFTALLTLSTFHLT